MGRSRAVKILRQQQFTSSLSMSLDDNGSLMIKVKPLFRRELRKILREINDEAREIVRVRHSGPSKNYKHTGHLRSSIKPTPIKNTAGGQRIYGSVTAGSIRAKYAALVHDGTPAHDIEPKKSRGPNAYLAFYWTGRKGKERPGLAHDKFGSGHRVVMTSDDLNDRRVIRKIVHHPGARRSGFLNQAAAKVVTRYGGTVQRR